MNKKLLFLAATIPVALGVFATPLTPEQALSRARNGVPAAMRARAKASLKPVYTAVSAAGQSAAYVFNTDGQGYMILAADDVAYPVLGYSETGSIDPQNMSPELKWWLGEYARQIEWAVEKGATEALKAPRANAEWTAIAPLVTTLWDQATPYNDQCPKYNNKLTMTGCVATSLAQVMNYHKYPEVGEGIKQYRCSSIGRTLTINFAKQAFDWNNMLNTYTSGNYTEEQGAAVAYLMKACGYSVEMSYGLDASGASGSDIDKALVTYFKYDTGTRTLRRNIYSGSQWEQMVYENLKNVGPMIINGQAPLQGGHSFVCDGYDGNGYFHFNWGWSGMSDGYYALDALNPDAQGIGGYAGGFNFQQNGIFGIQPPTEVPYTPQPGNLLQYGSTIASVTGGNMVFDTQDYDPLGWGNAYAKEINANIGASFEPVEGTAGEIQYVQGKLGQMTNINLTSMYSYFPSKNVKPTVALPSLPDGKYRVTLVTRDLDMENAQWQPIAVVWGHSNYCYLTVSGGKYSVANVSASRIAVSDAEPMSEMFAGKNFRLKAHFANNSDLELSNGVCPALLDASGNIKFVGESIIVSLIPGEQADKEWVSRFYDQNGNSSSVSADTEFTMIFYDPETQARYDGVNEKVILKPNPGSGTPTLKNFTIPDTEKDKWVDGDITYYVTYKVKDLAEIPFKMTYEIKKGYFDGQIILGIYEQDPTNKNSMIPVIDKVYSESPFISAGTIRDIDIKIDFSQGQKNKVYFIVGKYIMNSRETSLGRCTFVYDDGSGVSEIADDVDAPVEIYNLQGVRICEPMPGQMVIVKKGAKTSKQVWK